MARCDIRRVEGSRSADYDAELMQANIPAPFTLTTADSFVLPEADAWQALQIAVRRVSIKSSSRFKESSDRFKNAKAALDSISWSISPTSTRTPW